MKALVIALLLISAARVTGHRYLDDRAALLQTSSSSQSSVLQTSEPRNTQGTEAAVATIDRLRRRYSGPEFDAERQKLSMEQFQTSTPQQFDRFKADASSAFLVADVGESAVGQLEFPYWSPSVWGSPDADLPRIKAEMRAAMLQFMPDPTQAIHLLREYKGYNKVKVPEEAWAAIAGGLKRKVELFRQNTAMQDKLLDYLPRLRAMLATNLTSSMFWLMHKKLGSNGWGGNLFPMFTEVGARALHHVLPAGSAQSDPMPSFEAPPGKNPYAVVESYHGRKWAPASHHDCGYEVSLGFKHDFFLAEASSSPQNTKLVARVGAECFTKSTSSMTGELQFDIAPTDDTSTSLLLGQPVVSIGTNAGRRAEGTDDGGRSASEFTRATAGAGLQNNPDLSASASIFDAVDVASALDYSDYANFDSNKRQSSLEGWNFGTKYRESVDGAELMSAGNASRILIEVGADWPLVGGGLRIRAFAAPTK